MAFDLKKYIDNFKNIEKTPEGIREAAQTILAHKDELGKVFGNRSFTDWANQALGVLEGKYKGVKGTDDASIKKNVDEAFRWLSGGAQAHKAKSMQSRAAENRKEAQKKIANFASNAANILDIPADASPKERAKLEAKAAEIKKDMEEWINIGNVLGIDTIKAQNVVRTASGFVPAGEEAPPVDPNALPAWESPMREGEATVIKQESDGSFSIYGKDSGKKLEGGFSDTMNALSRKQERHSTILPPGTDIAGLSPGQVVSLEQVFLKSQQDSRLIAAQTLSDEDIAGFLDKARAETSPYFQHLFTRAQEDFTRGLEYKTFERELQLKQEQQNLQAGIEQTGEEAAASGLASSGIRQKAQRKMEEQAGDISASSRRQFGYDINTFGRSAEDLLGARNLPVNTIPTIGGERVFNPTEGVRGSLEREQVTSEQIRAADLQKEERLRRVSLIDSEAALEQLT